MKQTFKTISKMPIRLFGQSGETYETQIAGTEVVEKLNGDQIKENVFNHFDDAYNYWWEQLFPHLQLDFSGPRLAALGVDPSSWKRTYFAADSDPVCCINFYLEQWRFWDESSKEIAEDRILKGLEEGANPHGIWLEPAIIFASRFRLKTILEAILAKGVSIDSINSLNAGGLLFQTPLSEIVIRGNSQTEENIEWMEYLLSLGADADFNIQLLMDYFKSELTKNQLKQIKQTHRSYFQLLMAQAKTHANELESWLG